MKKIEKTVLKRLGTLVVIAVLSMGCVAVAAESTSDGKSVDPAAQLAYMDLNQVSDETLTDEILEARRDVIYSKDWCADGMDAYTFDAATGEIKEIPKFHDVFPEDWDLPVNDHFKDTNKFDILRLAYMDLNQVSDETLADEILEARRDVIYSKDWCADDMDAYTFDTATGKKEEIPKFHDVFPEDWDLPVNDNSNNTNTSEIQPRTDNFDDLKIFLRHPSETVATSPFKTISPSIYYGQYWCAANSIPGDSWNFGVTNMNDGTDWLTKLNLTPTTIISFSVNSWTTYGLRASTYSTQGHAYMRGGSGYAG